MMSNTITLRDHFAGLAIQGLLTNDDANDWTVEETANVAYQQADAMIAERNKHIKERHEELCDNEALKELCNGDD
jgi:hypothetical protein